MPTTYDATADSMARAISLNGFSFQQDGRNLLRLIEYIDNKLKAIVDDPEHDRAFTIKSYLRQYNAEHKWSANANPMLDALVDLYFIGLTLGMEI